jgi:putative SOS response-associated peptidase YedK
MCGRFTLSTPADRLAKFFRLDSFPELLPRYNVAPSQPIPVVRLHPGRELALLRWGLVPSWAKDPKAGVANARSETVAEKPTFRGAFRERRCLVPADGFYEWKPAGKHKQPFAIRMRDGEPFAFAGLWEEWVSPDGEVLQTTAVLTTDANAVVRPVHDRMPVIVPPEGFDAWLDPATDASLLRDLLRPYPAETMTAFPVSTWVSNPKHEGPRCLEPAEEQPGLF